MSKLIDNPSSDTGAAIGGTVTSGTAGSVLFINPNEVLAQDNTNLFWNTTSKELLVKGAIVNTIHGFFLMGG